MSKGTGEGKTDDTHARTSLPVPRIAGTRVRTSIIIVKKCQHHRGAGLAGSVAGRSSQQLSSVTPRRW
jgi:hypothetical protein